MSMPEDQVYKENALLEMRLAEMTAHRDAWREAWWRLYEDEVASGSPDERLEWEEDESA